MEGEPRVVRSLLEPGTMCVHDLEIDTLNIQDFPPLKIMYVQYVAGCKHSKVDQESAPVYKSHDFLGQTPISSSKMLFKNILFLMMTSIVKLGTQI